MSNGDNTSDKVPCHLSEKYSAKEYIKSDCYRYVGNARLSTMIKLYLLDAVFRWHVAFRLAKSSGFVKYIGMGLWIFNRTRKKFKYPLIPKLDMDYMLGMAVQL